MELVETSRAGEPQIVVEWAAVRIKAALLARAWGIA